MKQNNCPECGYPLNGTENVCPECGTNTTSESIHQPSTSTQDTNIKPFQNFFGVVSFIKCSKVINLTLRNVFMNVLNFGGNVLKYGGTYSKQSLLHFMVVPHAVNIFRL